MKNLEFLNSFSENAVNVLLKATMSEFSYKVSAAVLEQRVLCFDTELFEVEREELNTDVYQATFGSSMTLLTYSLNSSSWNTANASNSIESYAVEITEEYLRRVELPYNNNQVNPQTVTQRKVILFGKLGVEKASMIKLTHNDTNQQNSK